MVVRKLEVGPSYLKLNIRSCTVGCSPDSVALLFF